MTPFQKDIKEFIEEVKELVCLPYEIVTTLYRRVVCYFRGHILGRWKDHGRTCERCDGTQYRGGDEDRIYY